MARSPGTGWYACLRTGPIPENSVTTQYLCKFDVPGEPVPKGRPRFDAKRMRTYTPEKTVAAEQRLLQYLKVTYPRVNPSLAYVGLELRFYLGGTGRGDLDNYIKLVSDAMNGVVYRDDKQVRRIEADVIDNSDRPRTEISVYRLDSERPDDRRQAESIHSVAHE